MPIGVTPVPSPSMKSPRCSSKEFKELELESAEQQKLWTSEDRHY
jgi:hypothetical protein